MDKNLKIFIAGHGGLVGSAIKKKLEEAGYSNLVFKTSKELDLRRQDQTEAFFEKERPDWVFLCAAKVGGILANSTYKAEFIYDNLAIALNVINSSYKTGVKKLLNMGSSCIFPKLCPQPMKEEYLLSGYLEPTNEPYAIAKISAIKLCRYYNEQHGTNFISVMPTNLYGPKDNFNLETAHVLPALLRKAHLCRLLKNKDYSAIAKDLKRYPIGFGLSRTIDFADDDSIVSALNKTGIFEDRLVMWGSGEVYREFLHTSDLADAALFLMERYNYPDVGEFVNIGTGEDVKLKDLALMIKEAAGFDGEIAHDVTKPDGTPRKLLDVSRMNGLGWKAGIGLEEGIRRVYESYLQIKGIA